jgi:hypothetical protein
MHKTYAARLMGGEAAAPAVATSILRFMVDLAKMCPPFSAVCRRHDFLENCIDLYFSCVRFVQCVNVHISCYYFFPQQYIMLLGAEMFILSLVLVM